MTNRLSLLAVLGLFLLLSQAEKSNPTDQADARDPTAHAEEEGKPSLYDHACHCGPSLWVLLYFIM